jgi:hypothetical protein
MSINIAEDLQGENAVPNFQILLGTILIGTVPQH